MYKYGATDIILVLELAKILLPMVKDKNQMNVSRRTCGYIGSQFWNQGRTQEIKERVLHLGDN